MVRKNWNINSIRIPQYRNKNKFIQLFGKYLKIYKISLSFHKN